MKKMYVGLAVLVAVVGIFAIGGVGYNLDEEFTVVQYPWGNITSFDDAGVFFKCFGKSKSYPDMDLLYFSKDAREGSEDDESIETLFTDRGKGWWSFQVAVRNPDNKMDQIAFHKRCGGDYDTYRDTINARLKSAGRKFAEVSSSSDAAQNQSGFTEDVENALKIDDFIANKFKSTIDAVELTGVEFDTKTKTLFETQQESNLLKKQAEIDAQKFAQQTLSTKAEYEQKIAQQKGEADMIAMKAVTDAEREKELAEIAANQKVEVAKLETLEQNALKEKALVEAQRGLEVATLERETADQNAEAQKLLADARKYQLEVGGAISERDKVLAEINAKRDAMVAAELSNVQVPYIVMGGGSGAEGGGSSTLTESMFQMKLMESMGILDPVAGKTK